MWTTPFAVAAGFACFNMIWQIINGGFINWYYIVATFGLLYCWLGSEHKTNRQNEFLASLHETTLGLINRLDSDDLLRAIVKRAGELLATPHGYIYLVDKDAAVIKINVGVGLYSDKIGQNRELGQGLCGKVWQTGQPIAVEDYQLWRGKLPDSALNAVHSAIGVPLKSGSQVVGVLGLDYIQKGRAFGEDEVNLLSRFAELASVALDNARLYTAAQDDLTQQKLAKEALKEAQTKIRLQNEYLACLHETALALMNRLELTDLLETIILRLNNLAGTENSFVTLSDEDRGVTIIKVGTGIYAPLIGLEVKIGEGMSGKVLKTGKPVLVNDYNLWRSRLSNVEFDAVQSVIGVPLKTDGQVIGVIGLAYPNKDRQFLDDDIDFLNGFAKLASIAIDNARLYNEAQYLSFHDKLTGLYNRVFFEEESRRVSSERFYPLGVIAGDIDGLKLANDTLGHAHGDALLKQAAKLIRRCFRQSDVVARTGGDEFAVLLPNTSLEAIEIACNRIRDTIEEYNKSNPGFPLSMSIGYAVTADDSKSIQQLLKEADDYMYREKLHRSQSTRSSIVQTLKKALEARDFITEGHADRLQHLVAELGKSIGFPEHQISDLRLLAQFHDIGKVGIPDHILFKNGPLTDKEFIEMRRHSEIGYRIAHSAPDLAPIAHCILKHHEWWNGQGYPLMLKKNQIPLECRILAIADAFDAMTSDRPYRKAMPVQQALTEIRRCSGTQFDPDLVDKFIDYIKKSDYYSDAFSIKA